MIAMQLSSVVQYNEDILIYRYNYNERQITVITWNIKYLIFLMCQKNNTYLRYSVAAGQVGSWGRFKTKNYRTGNEQQNLATLRAY